MLALSEMIVVFVLDEPISQGIEASMTADRHPKGNYGFRLESATVTEFYLKR